LRLLLGGRNTTPILSLQAEAGIAPLCLHREYLNVKQLIKFKCNRPNSATTNMLNLVGPTMQPCNYSFNSYPNRAVKSMQQIEMPPVKIIPTGDFIVLPWTKVNSYIVLEFMDKVNNNDTFKK
jgi:hypothetical protein